MKTIQQEAAEAAKEYADEYPGDNAMYHIGREDGYYTGYLSRQLAISA